LVVPDAMRFVNSQEGRERRWRGMNTRVLHGGAGRVGDLIRVMRAVAVVPAQPGPDLGELNDV
jgi:hypothetical protein